MMIEIFLELICCRDGGVKKSEVLWRLVQLGHEKEDIIKIFNRIYYARYRSDSFSVILLNNQKKWYTFDNIEYCKGLIRQIKETNKPVQKPDGMPYPVYERWDTLRKIFINYEY